MGNAPPIIAPHAIHSLSLIHICTAPWKNPEAWKHKVEWVQRHLPEVAHKRLILSHHKHLNKGDYLVDDRPNNGADRFEGKLIVFGKEPFRDWPSVLAHLMAQ